MLVLRRWVLYLMVPLNVALTAWVLAGRGLFGVEIGWRFLFVLFFIVPVLAVCLTASTVLAYRQKLRPVRLSAGQAWSQLVFWAALVFGGAAVIDFVDADLGEPRESVLTEVLGVSLSVSHTSMYVAAAVATIAWLTLVVLLVGGVRVKERSAIATMRRTDEAELRR